MASQASARLRVLWSLALSMSALTLVLLLRPCALSGTAAPLHASGGARGGTIAAAPAGGVAAAVAAAAAMAAGKAAGAAATAAAAAPPAKRSYKAPIDDVLAGCGDICRTDMPGSPGKFFDHIRKQVDCGALLTNAAIDAAMEEPQPPTTFPEHLAALYTFGGRIPVRSWLGGDRVFNQRYLGGTAEKADWSRELLEDWKGQCERGELGGTYGNGPTKALRDALDHVRVGGGRVLVIGSENPWVEACLLAKGAKEVVTLEYGAIKSTHPQVATMTPGQARARAGELRDYFDAVVTFSSLEHSGLGRYGDAMNPYGDRQATARAWCMTRPGGRMLAGIPAEADGTSDMIHYNAHRSYGKVQLPHLFANWKQVWGGGAGDVHHMWVVEKP